MSSKTAVKITGLKEIADGLIGQQGRVYLDAINLKGERTPYELTLLEGWDRHGLAVAVQSVRLCSPDVLTVHIKSIKVIRSNSF